jgi:hypothetical protein
LGFERIVPIELARMATAGNRLVFL